MQSLSTQCFIQWRVLSIVYTAGFWDGIFQAWWESKPWSTDYSYRETNQLYMVRRGLKHDRDLKQQQRQWKRHSESEIVLLPASSPLFQLF